MDLYPAMNSLDDGLLTVTFTLADSNKEMITNVRLSNKSRLILSYLLKIKLTLN